MEFATPPYGGVPTEVPFLPSIVIEHEDEWFQYHARDPCVDASNPSDIPQVERVAGFIQGWLYFGLLAVLSGKTINGHDFSILGMRWPSIISSELVESTITEMQLGVLQLSRRDREIVVRKHEAILFRAEEAIERFENHAIQLSSALIDLILLSVRMLVETIRCSHDEVRFKQAGEIPPSLVGAAQSDGGHSKAASRALKILMLEKGWCVHQIHKVLSSFSYQTAYYFARLPRPGSARLTHDACTKVSCQGWNSKPGRTRARHATDDCTCSTIFISSMEVAKIIQGGGFPLVSIETDVDSCPVLKVHSKTWASKYVAISHVWADGLGNTFENGLPACQLQMLQTYFAQISETSSATSVVTPTTRPTPFWMDTLCIPVQNPATERLIPNQVLDDLRRRAISRMNMIYTSSSHTLVLDAEMRTIPTSADQATKLAYSQICGWTTRSWTLQEGFLPPSIVYALADGIYSNKNSHPGQNSLVGSSRFRISVFSDRLEKEFSSQQLVAQYLRPNAETLAKHLDSTIHDEIWTSFSARFFSIRDAYKPDMPRRKDFLVRNRYAAAWNGLLERVSSLPADTPVIFANLLGVTSYEVMKRETEQERIALIIRQQKILPLEILFNTGLRLREPLQKQRFVSSVLLRKRQRVAHMQSVPEEAIGLADMATSHHQQTFSNGWVPATISGDKYLRPADGNLYLKVREDCLQLCVDGKEQYASMYMFLEPHLAASMFVINSTCPSANKRHARNTLIAIYRAETPSAHTVEQWKLENILGHCFLYDPGSLRAMCDGNIYDVLGTHLLITSRSDGRLKTRYSGPIRLSLVTEEHQRSEELPTLGCECNCSACSIKQVFLDIVYDAQDLGPILSDSPECPEQVMKRHWILSIFVFLAHWYLSRPMEPYKHQGLVTTALFARHAADGISTQPFRPSIGSATALL